MTAVAEKKASGIRPFTIQVPEADLEVLRARIVATGWPEKETVPDQSQGPRLATMRALADCWATEYDWRKCEARINSFPQFLTRSTDWTSISSMCGRSTRMRCRSSSATAGQVRLWSS